MKQIRAERPRHRGNQADAEIFPQDPRDPDIVRAKAVGTARKPAAKPAG